VHAYGDTSASVDSKTLGVFLGELERLCEVMPVYWNMFDTAIQLKEPILFDNQRISQMKILGRGGTNFQAVIDDAEKRRARFVVILTDGECSVPEVKDKSMQIIWVICPGGRAPADLPGKIIHMKKVY
jgi:predicted metal-dependent peptidase